MESDVLVVGEARPYVHADLVVAEVEGGEYWLFKSSSRGQPLPVTACQGRVGLLQFRGVVVRQARCWAV